MRFFARFAGSIAAVYVGLAAAADAPAKPDLERGRQIATTVCAACHGANGISTASANPNLAGQHAGYIAEELAAYKSGARPNAIMQGMAAALSPEDMRNVAAYYAMQKPAQTVARDKALAQRGQQIWRAGIKPLGVPACAGCHGATGAGIPAQYPRLAGQHPELTLGWLKAYASGARPNEVMSPIAQRLNDADMRAVTEYIAGLR